MSRCLRQGDPLSTFLFVLVMEVLHVDLVRELMANVYRGICIKGIDISHLFFTDNIVLLAKWNHTNALHIVCILRCFFLASG